MKDIINNEKINTDRRAFMRTAPAAGLAAMMAGAVSAYQMPDAPVEDTPDLPEWWSKLTGPSAKTDPEVFHPWQDTVLTRELGRKLDELRELLLLMGTPVGVDTITDFRMHWLDDVPQNVMVIGRSGTYGEGLHRFRPEFGWKQYSANVGWAIGA